MLLQSGFGWAARASRKAARLLLSTIAVPVSTPPFYATELRLSLLCMTSTGLRIDADAHVIDERSHVIPGLFAAGECTGGVLGDIYVGSGNSYANCIVFGRTAGRVAAKETRSRRAAAP